MGQVAEPPPLPVIEPELDAQDLASRRRRRLQQLATVGAVVLIALGGIAWATDGFSRGDLLGQIAPRCPPTIGLNGSGSTFIVPLMQSWIKEYVGAAASREQGCVVVLPNYTAPGSLSGLQRLGSYGTEFAVTEEPLGPAGEAALPVPTVTLPLAVSAVAVVYNLPGLDGALRLTGALLAGIYLGTITSWNASVLQAANPGLTLPSLPITAIHQTGGSSTSYVFTGFLNASNGTWASNVGQGNNVSWPVGPGGSGDSGAASVLANTSGGIAYVGLGTALRDGLSVAEVRNPAGLYVAPSTPTVYAALNAHTGTLPLGNQSWAGVSLLDEPGNTSYPLTTFTYAIVYEDLGTAYRGALSLTVAQWLAAYLYWMSVAGQPYGTPLGYAPFSQTVTNGNVQIVELLKYDGRPALGDVDFDGD